MIIKYITTVNVGNGDLEVTWKESYVMFCFDVFLKKSVRNSYQGANKRIKM